MYERTDLKIIGTMLALLALGLAATDASIWVGLMCIGLFAVCWGLALLAPDSWFRPPED